ncbi:MAG: GntR family transcriptional regulator [Denitrovibrio sp.]|nr:MAG: GntR family transcriptional regulator [Denitrovibrio sp.]
MAIKDLNVQNEKPLYIQLVELIKERIADNIWSIGMMIPSENELARELDVSAGTVKKALNVCVQDGVLFRRQGKGTFVASPDFSKSFNRFFRFASKDGEQNIPATETLVLEVIEAPSEIAEKLKITTGEKVIKYRRTRTLNGITFVVEDIYLIYETFKGFENYNLSGKFLYPIFHSDFGTPILWAKEDIHPDVADKNTAELLGIELKAPVMCIERIAYTHKDQPVEVRFSIGRGDTFRYSIIVR